MNDNDQTETSLKKFTKEHLIFNYMVKQNQCIIQKSDIDQMKKDIDTLKMDLHKARNSVESAKRINAVLLDINNHILEAFKCAKDEIGVV